MKHISHIWVTVFKKPTITQHLPEPFRIMKYYSLKRMFGINPRIVGLPILLAGLLLFGLYFNYPLETYHTLQHRGWADAVAFEALIFSGMFGFIFIVIGTISLLYPEDTDECWGEAFSIILSGEFIRPILVFAAVLVLILMVLSKT